MSIIPVGELRSDPKAIIMWSDLSDAAKERLQNSSMANAEYMKKIMAGEYPICELRVNLEFKSQPEEEKTDEEKRRIKLFNDVFALLRDPNMRVGSISDGYHTFDELYDHRAKLFATICNTHSQISWKSKNHHNSDTDPMYEGMFIVGIDTPKGQATYHYDIDPYWEMFKVPEKPNAPEWDGHTPEQAIERILSLGGWYEAGNYNGDCAEPLSFDTMTSDELSLIFLHHSSEAYYETLVVAVPYREGRDYKILLNELKSEYYGYEGIPTTFTTIAKRFFALKTPTEFGKVYYPDMVGLDPNDYHDVCYLWV